MLKMRRKVAAVLTGVMLLSVLTSCGKDDKKKYVSPNLNTATESDAATSTDARNNHSVPGDYSQYSQGTPVEVKDDKASGTNAQSITGYYEDDTYYNSFAGFAILGDSSVWRFLSAKELASATDATEDEINNYWYGVNSPYGTQVTYCAVVVNAQTGTNIVVSYINPKAYYMSDLTPVEYLNMTATNYKGLTVSEGKYLGRTYAMLDIPADQTSSGERVQFVTEVDGLLVVITYSIQDGDTLQGASNHLTQLKSK